MNPYLRTDIQQRSWAYDFVVNGRRYRKTLGDISKTRAKEIYQKARAAALEGRYAEPKQEDPYLRDFIGEYFDYYRANRRRRSAERHGYSWVAIAPAFGHMKLSEITSQKIERYRQNRQKIGRSNVTINRELAFLRNVFSVAEKWDRLDRIRSNRSNSLGRTMAGPVISQTMKNGGYWPSASPTSTE